jgi:hypothetical protein
MAERLSYRESFERAAKTEALEGSPKPDISVRPRHDDENPGPYYFKTLVADSNLGGFTLYGLLIGRSEVRNVRFVGADLHLSTFCWNDFFDCDFSEADLSQSDLRASNFTSCKFRSANLEGCDLRHATFKSCDFEGAKMSGALLTHQQKPTLKLTAEQQKSIPWKLSAGSEPEGG